MSGGVGAGSCGGADMALRYRPPPHAGNGDVGRCPRHHVAAGGKMPSTAVERLRSLTRVLDDLVPIPGTRFRFGLDPIIGLVPGLGDAAGAVFAGFILLTAWRAGAPAAVLLRMAGNIVVDTVVGAVPVLGDLFDFGWKANRRNLRLVERWEAEPLVV